MARITMMVGFVLFALGVAFWGITGKVAPTALIPSYFGIALMVCGALSRRASRRKLFMHVAVTIGLLGFLFPGIRALMTWMKLHEASAALQEELMMALICLLFVLLCVRSFVKARTETVAAEPESAA